MGISGLLGGIMFLKEMFQKSYKGYILLDFIVYWYTTIFWCADYKYNHKNDCQGHFDSHLPRNLTKCSFKGARLPRDAASTSPFYLFRSARFPCEATPILPFSLLRGTRKNVKKLVMCKCQYEPAQDIGT